MATVEGVERLVKRLGDMAARAKADAAEQVVVGFSAPYATSVHEDREAHHENGQAGFLEQPTRTEATVMAGIIAREVKAGKSLPEAELVAGQYLLGKAQEIVPVKSGFLRDSGFASLEDV